MCLAVPGQIVGPVEEDGVLRQAYVSFGGVRRRVNLSCTPEAMPGDFVLVHAGVAITVIAEEEARRTLEALRQAADGTGSSILER